MRLRPLLEERTTLVDAKTVLLVHHRQAQLSEPNSLLEERVGPHHQRHAAVGQCPQHLAAGGRGFRMPSAVPG